MRKAHARREVAAIEHDYLTAVNKRMAWQLRLTSCALSRGQIAEPATIQAEATQVAAGPGAPTRSGHWRRGSSANFDNPTDEQLAWLWLVAIL
jgi:hypothetical protein